MKKLSPDGKIRLMAYIQIVIGCILGGVAYPLFMSPNNIAAGGLTGVGVILNYVYPKLPVGTTSLILNIPLFIIGYRSIGRVFAFRSLIATILFSICIDVLPFKAMTLDPLLGTLFGGVLLGIGLGLILRGGATTGGSDMIARMVHKRYAFITVGSFLFAIDFTVVVCSGFVIGTSQALYALINIYISARVIDTVMIGFSGNKACFIISEKWEAIAQRLLREMDRGVTYLKGVGVYTGIERPVVLCVISRQEVMEVKCIVRKEDDNAFVFITEAHEALGEGFKGLDED